MTLDVTADLVTMLTDFGQDVTYTPNGGAAVVIKAIFDAAYEDVQNIDSTAPAVTVKTSDAANAKPGDTVAVGAVVYNVTSVQPDGTGVTVLILSRD